MQSKKELVHMNVMVFLLVETRMHDTYGPKVSDEKEEKKSKWRSFPFNQLLYLKLFSYFNIFRNK